MFLKDIRLKTFPIGSGSCKLSVSHITAYNKMLVDIGTAKAISFTPEQAELFEGLPLVSHTEMVESLAPEGSPDLIVLSYWMTDPDGSCDSVVSGIRHKFHVDAKQTIVLGETGPGVLFNALEYADRAIKCSGFNEVWLFFLNQFQGKSPNDGRIFSSAPAVGLWLRITSTIEDGVGYPAIRITRDTHEKEKNAGFDFSNAWESLSSGLETLAAHKGRESWAYRYDCEHNCLSYDVEIAAA